MEGCSRWNLYIQIYLGILNFDCSLYIQNILKFHGLTNLGSQNSCRAGWRSSMDFAQRSSYHMVAIVLWRASTRMKPFRS